MSEQPGSSVTTTSTVLPDGTTTVEQTTKTVNPDGSVTEEVQTWTIPPGHGAQLGGAVGGGGGGGGGVPPDAYAQSPGQDPYVPQQQQHQYQAQRPYQEPYQEQQPYREPYQPPLPPPPAAGVGWGVSPEPFQNEVTGGGGGGGGGGAPAGSRPTDDEHKAEHDSGRRKKRRVIIIAALVLAVVALAVGLGVGLGTRDRGGGDGGGGSSGLLEGPQPEGACSIDGIDSVCSPGSDGQFELCFDPSDRDGAAVCASWVRDTTNGENWCCRGCRVCPSGCSFPVAHDCRNLNDDFFGSCECPPEVDKDAPVPAPAAPAGPAPTPAPAPTRPAPTQPAPTRPSPTAPSGGPSGGGSACDMGGANVGCQDATEDGSLSFCIDSNPAGTQCTFWIRENGPGGSEYCCRSCGVCDDGCEFGISYDCTNHADTFSGGLGGDCGTCTGGMPTQPTPTPPTAPSGGGRSACELDGGTDLGCQDATDDGSLSFCIDADDGGGPECSFWIRDNSGGGGADYCCDSCSVCDEGCVNDISYDCSNHAGTFSGTLGGDCGNCTGGSPTRAPATGPAPTTGGSPTRAPATVPTATVPTATVPTSPTAPAAAPAARPTPRPTPRIVEFYNSECMLDGSDVACMALEGTELYFCGDFGDSGCNLWFQDEDASLDACCQGCTICPLGCATAFAADCTNAVPDWANACDC